MQGLDIVVTGATLWDQATEFDLAVPDNVKYVGIYGGTLDRSKRNLVLGGGDLGVAGSPGVGPNYLDLKTGSAYLTMPFGDAPTLTYCVVCNLTDTMVDGSTTPHIMGTKQTNAGSILYADDGNGRLRAIVGGTAGGANSLPTVTLSPATPAVPMCIFVTISETAVTIYNMTNNTSATTTLPAGYVRSLASAIYVGGGPLTDSKAGKVRVYAAVYWASKVLSASERTLQYNQMKTLYASLGVSI